MLFFNIDFLGFRPRFWSLLGLQLGTALGILASKKLSGLPVGTLLSYMSFKDCVLEASGLDVGILSLDFVRSGDDVPRFSDSVSQKYWN